MAQDSPEITLIQYGGTNSTQTMSHPCGKVHMALVLKGLDYKTRNVKSPAQVKKYNARGRVPVLIVDGEHIVDSSDILTELDRRYPAPPLLPADPAERAQVKILEDWADEVLYFYGVYLRWRVPENFEFIRRNVLAKLPIPLRWIVPIIAQRQVRARTDGQGVGLKDEATVRRELLECLDALDAMLEGGTFAVGNSLTRADLALASMVDQLRLRNIQTGVADEVDRRSNIAAWLTRVHETVPSFAG